MAPSPSSLMSHPGIVVTSGRGRRYRSSSMVCNPRWGWGPRRSSTGGPKSCRGLRTCSPSWRDQVHAAAMPTQSPASGMGEEGEGRGQGVGHVGWTHGWKLQRLSGPREGMSDEAAEHRADLGDEAVLEGGDHPEVATAPWRPPEEMSMALAARQTGPSAVTTSAKPRLSVASPSFSSSQPTPAPRVSPAMPVSEKVPPVVARPKAWHSGVQPAPLTGSAAQWLRRGRPRGSPSCPRNR